MARNRKYFNKEQSYVATCPEGQTGTSRGYVPARWTWSSESVDKANEMALAEATRRAKEKLICEPIGEPPPTDTWYKWCNENETVTLPDNTLVRYGKDMQWSDTRIMSGSVTANNETFGDPAPGIVKELQATKEKPIVIEPGPEPEPPPTGETIVVDVTNVIKADGVTDNAAALKNLANTYREKPELIVFVMPAGTIMTTSNTWMRGLLKWKATCNSGQFVWKHTGGNDWYVSHSPFLVDGLFFNVEGELGGQHLMPSALFKTARQGDNFITLKDPSLTYHFKKDAYQFLEGFECQGQGWPINPRFFEWKYIADVNANTGVITFTEPLEYNYNQEWKDWDYGAEGYYGKPRIHVLDPLLIKYVEMSNGKIIPQTGFLNNPDNYSAVFMSADELYFDNMQLDGNALWPTADRIARYNNCRGGGWEIDKCIGTMLMTNSKIPGLWAGTGLHQLLVKDTEFTSFSPMTPQKALFDNVQFNTGNVDATASIYDFRWWTGCDTWQFKNCTFSKVCPPIVVTTLQITVGDVSGNTFTLPDAAAWDSPNHEFAKLCFQGSPVWNNNVRIRMDDVIHRNGQYVVQFTPEQGTVTKGMTLSYRVVRRVDDLGGNRYPDGTPINIASVSESRVGVQPPNKAAHQSMMLNRRHLR